MSRFNINANGFIGIGTASPLNPVSIITSSAATSSLGSVIPIMGIANTSTTTGNYTLVSLQTNDNAGTLVRAATFGSQATNRTANSVVGDFFVATVSGSVNTERFRITGAGNIGIGGATTTILDPLSITTAINASATHALFNLSNTALSGGSATGTYIGANPAAFTGNFEDYQVAGATRFRVAASLIPTASYGLVSLGNGGFSGGGGFAGSATGTQLAVNAVTGFTGDLINLEVAGTSKVKVDYQGNLTVSGPSGSCIITGGSASSTTIVAGTGAALYCSSDARLKTNIVDLSSALDKINQLRPVEFNWNNDPTGQKSIGFIAQDVQQIYPQFVSVVDPQTGYLGVNYQAFVSPIVKSIQEMDLKLEPLTSLDPAQDGSLASLIKKYLADALNGIQKVFAGEVDTNKLCVGATCLNEAQVQQVLHMIEQGQGASGLPSNDGTSTGNTTTSNTNSSTATTSNITDTTTSSTDVTTSNSATTTTDSASNTSVVVPDVTPSTNPTTDVAPIMPAVTDTTTSAPVVQ